MAAIRQSWLVFRWIALALYLTATLSAGLPHRAMAQPVDPLADFVLPDGTRPVICTSVAGDAEDAAPKGAKRAGSLCEACRLSTIPGVVPVEDAWTPAERIVADVVYVWADRRGERCGDVEAPHARGPPGADRTA